MKERKRTKELGKSLSYSTKIRTNHTHTHNDMEKDGNKDRGIEKKRIQEILPKISLLASR
jgi:hypothetical protein